LWRLKPGVLSAPILSGWDGRLFVTVEQKLHCYTASGFLLWSRELEHKAALEPRMNRRGGMIMALENGDLLEIDPFGALTKKALGEVPSAIVPADGGTLVFFKNGGMRFIQSNGVENRLPNLKEGAVGGISRGNRAALVLSNGTVVQISLPDGKVLWTGDSQLRSASAKETALVYDERGIYLLSPSGAVGFTDEGKRLWLLMISGSEGIPVLSDEGMLFSGGSDWILYAYKLENRLHTQGQSLYGPAPEGSYGLGNPPPSPWADYVYRFEESELNTRLADIAELIRTGKVGENEGAYMAYLMETASTSLNPQVSDTHPPVQVKQRAEALRLLGFIGSRETIPFLSNVYVGDPDPTVKAAAAEAIGRIGVDPEGIALKAFAQSAMAAARDEQVLIAAASAIGSLCRFSGPPLSESGVRLLGILGRDFMPTPVRAQAKRELDSMR
jgi:outer membrane protein assembly factor BamB